MAHPNAELEEKLARRRASGEQAFESDAAASSADAAHATTSVGAFPADPSAGSSAFEAALQKIQAFERDRASRGLGMTAHLPAEDLLAEEEEAVEGQNPPWLQYCDAEWELVPIAGGDTAECAESADPDAPLEPDEPDEPAASASGSDPAAPDRMVAKRQDLKSAVQTRYFQLLEQGLDPNAAASRAILEAAGLQAESVEATDGAGAALPATRGSGSSNGSPRSTVSHSSCASTARSGHADGRRRRKKSVVAVA